MQPNEIETYSGAVTVPPGDSNTIRTRLALYLGFNCSFTS